MSDNIQQIKSILHSFCYQKLIITKCQCEIKPLRIMQLNFLLTSGSGMHDGRPRPYSV